MMKVSQVEAFPGYKIRVRYLDGVEGEVDLSQDVGKGVFAAWEDLDFFESVHVSSHGSIAWSDDIEICADSIYLELSGKTPEEVFRRAPISHS